MHHRRRHHTPAPEEVRLFPAAPRRLAVALALSAPLAACDTHPEATIFPEFEFLFSFEQGIAEWTPASADLGAGSASVTGAQDQASQGTRSAKLSLDNPAGSGKVWMTRELDVTPDQRYSVEVTFDLRTSDAAGDAWALVTAVKPEPPVSSAALEYQGDTSAGGQAGGGWVEKSVTLLAQADEEGRLYLTLGLWGTTAGTRDYWIDNVRLVLMRI